MRTLSGLLVRADVRQAYPAALAFTSVVGVPTTDMGTIVANYDSTEARQLLASAGDKINPNDEDRITAADALLSALVSLNGESGFRFDNSKNPKVVAVWFPDDPGALQPPLSVRYKSQSREFALVGRGSEFQLKLQFDPINKVFLGTERSTPNEQQERESALTTLARAVVEHALPPEPF